jgi:hypothetical protein
MTDSENDRENGAEPDAESQGGRAKPEARDPSEEAERPRFRGDAGGEAGRDRPDALDPSPTCHRRGCTEPASFVVLERYQEETGHGAVEAEAFLCRDHTDEESPTNLEGVYADYVFRVEPIGEAPDSDTA